MVSLAGQLGENILRISLDVKSLEKTLRRARSEFGNTVCTTSKKEITNPEHNGAFLILCLAGRIY